MPRIAPKCDHHGAAHVVVEKAPFLPYVQTLGKALKSVPDKTILRATTPQDKQIIYFRRAPNVSQALRDKSKNRAEIEANCTEMRSVLSDIAVSVEKKLGKAPARKEREAVASLNDLAASRRGDITALDIRQPLGIIGTRLAHLQRLQDVKKTHQSPPKSQAASLKNMLRRFDRMDDIQKKNLKKILFPASSGIDLLRQEVVLKEMQTLVLLLIKNPEALPAEMAQKFCDMNNLKLFVNAWLAARPDGEKRKDGTASAHDQFAWRQGMDRICSALKSAVFVKKGGTVSGNSSPAPLAATPTLSPIGRKTFKPKQKIPAPEKQLLRKRLASGSDETALEALIGKIVTSDRQTELKLTTQISAQSKAINNRQQSNPLLQTSPSGSMASDDSSLSPSLPGLLRKTASRVLEERILKFSAAEAKAKVNADIARIRLQALLHSRSTHAANSVVQNAMRLEIAQVSGGESQRTQSLGFGEARQRIMSVTMGESVPVPDADAALSEDNSLEQLLPGLHTNMTLVSGSARLGDGFLSEESDESFLFSLTDAVNAPFQTVGRSTSVMQFTIDPVALPFPSDALLSLSDDKPDENSAPAPVLLYTAQTTQTQTLEKKMT